MSDQDLDFKLAKRELGKAKLELEKSKPKKAHEPPYCSFCGKGKNEYLHLIEGKKTSKICDSCIFGCMELLKEKINDT